MKFITRTVWILSLVSLFTDAASEMLYPIMPIYLQQIGYSVVFIGILEGIAEAIAGFSKGYFGKLSDYSGKRIPFVQVGYLLSAISKPIMGIFIYPFWIFLARTIDRIGKGIRTGARDALLSDEATSETKGRVFGFHRSMDTLGAVIGPLSALVYLNYFPEKYAHLFIIAFIPGLFAVISSLFLKQKKTTSIKQIQKPSLFSFIHYWKIASPNYRKLIIGLIGFTLINSSDIFLLLKAKSTGLSDSYVIGIYIVYNLTYALFAFPLGHLSDRIGFKHTFIGGILLFALVYLGMGLSSNVYTITILFMAYGIYAAATEGVSKAWISNLANKNDTATAIGFYAAFQSLAAIIASSAAGILWYTYGNTFPFLFTGIASIALSVYFIIVFRSNTSHASQ